MDSLWRLLWALPLVLAVGLATMVLLRKVLRTDVSRHAEKRHMRLGESLRLSDDTQVHYLSVDGRTYLVVESNRHNTLTRADDAAATGRRRPAWLQNFVGTARSA